MLNIFLQISDLIAPPHETVAMLRQENPDYFIRLFSPQRFSGLTALSDYSQPTIKAAISANKFHNHKKAAELLATLFNHWLDTLPPKPSLIVPIPLSTKRERERGYNQVARILYYTTHENCKVEPLLTRTKETLPQTSLAREERFQNVKDIFHLNTKPELLSGQRIIIVDDVVTTGATLHSARSTLVAQLPPDCELICVALAH